MEAGFFYVQSGVYILRSYLPKNDIAYNFTPEMLIENL